MHSIWCLVTKLQNVPLTFLLQCKNLWKNHVEWRNSCQQIPEKDQSYVKVGRNNIHYIKVLKLWVRLWSIFHCNVNSEFTFDEQWMKKAPQDSTLDFFWFLSKNFFSKFELLNSGCSLSAGFYGISYSPKPAWARQKSCPIATFLVILIWRLRRLGRLHRKTFTLPSTKFNAIFTSPEQLQILIWFHLNLTISWQKH